MARNPILPVPNEPDDSYDQRMRFRVERELQDIKSKNKNVFENRLSAYSSAVAAPTGTANKYAQGDIVRNSAPVEAGAGGSKYVVFGFLCVASGTPGTWVQMRVLTGN